MKLEIRSMFDGHWMGSVCAQTDDEAQLLAADVLAYDSTDAESGTGDDDMAGLYEGTIFHGIVTASTRPRIGTQRQRRNG